jgi:hypothetical protein
MGAGEAHKIMDVPLFTPVKRKSKCTCNFRILTLILEGVRLRLRSWILDSTTGIRIFQLRSEAELSFLMKFEWDQDKAASNLSNHGVSFDEAMTVFIDPLYVDFFDPDHSHNEH